MQFVAYVSQIQNHSRRSLCTDVEFRKRYSDILQMLISKVLRCDNSSNLSSHCTLRDIKAGKEIPTTESYTRCSFASPTWKKAVRHALYVCGDARSHDIKNPQLSSLPSKPHPFASRSKRLNILVNVICCFLFFKILVQDIMHQMLPQASCAVFSLCAKHKQYLKCPRFSPPSQLLQYDNMPAAASLVSETPIKTTICANTSIKI
jgi:hypothetical protein